MAYISYALTVALVIILAYITTRYLSVVYQKGMQQRRIKVIEKINLAADKHLWLIEFGEKYYFMYSDRKGMTQIDRLDSLPEIHPEVQSVLPQAILSPFEALLQKRKGKDNHEPKV